MLTLAPFDNRNIVDCPLPILLTFPEYELGRVVVVVWRRERGVMSHLGFRCTTR
jgi:hypothetical protein